MAEALRYYPDESVSAALAAHLRARGIDSLSALDVGRAGTSIADGDQFRFAQEQGRVFITAHLTSPHEMRDRLLFCDW